MAWGIPGNVGEIYRKQQSDELRDQLLKQEMAQRIRQFDEEQKLRRDEMAARAEENAANRRMDSNRLGLEEMRMTRQQMTDDEERNLRESQQRAATNLQGLIPLVDRRTPQGRQEITSQLARISPVKAAEMALEPSEEDKAADRLRTLGQEREIIERTQAKYAPPQRPQYMEVPDVDEKGNAITRVMTAEQAAGRTFKRSVPTKPPTGLQNTALGYYKRMDEAIKTMDEVESKVSDKDIYLINNSPLPNLINNPLLSEAGQIYAQALGTYTEARLRKESGAAIAEHEFGQDRRTIGRQVGDTPKTMQKKQQTRKTTARGLAIAAGPAYEQEFGEPLEKLGTGDEDAAPASVAALLKGKPPKRYNLNDGTSWNVNPDGSVTKAR